MTLGWHKQRRLERALFGPEPEPLRRPRPKRPRATELADLRFRPGDCPMCGNACSPHREPWRCPFCRAVYPPADD